MVLVLDVLVKNCQETGNEEETPEWFEFVRCQKQLDIMIWRGQREGLVICKFRILNEIRSKLTSSPHLVSFLRSRCYFIHVIDVCGPNSIADHMKSRAFSFHFNVCNYSGTSHQHKHERGNDVTVSRRRLRRVKTLTEEVNAAQGRLTDAAARGEDGDRRCGPCMAD